MSDYDWRDENWNKLSFIYDGDDGNGDVESEYREELYNVLNEILHRLKNLKTNLTCISFNFSQMMKESVLTLGLVVMVINLFLTMMVYQTHLQPIHNTK